MSTRAFEIRYTRNGANEVFHTTSSANLKEDSHQAAKLLKQHLLPGYGVVELQGSTGAIYAALLKAHGIEITGVTEV